MSRTSGYSLLELVVTLVIAGIVLAVAVPRFTGNETQTVWYYEQVKAAMRFAQRQAVAQRRGIYVCVSASSVSLGYNSTCSTALVKPGTVAAYTIAAPTGVTFTNPAPPFTFSFNGLGQPSAALTVTVSGFGNTHSITVTSETGYVI